MGSRATFDVSGNSGEVSPPLPLSANDRRALGAMGVVQILLGNVCCLLGGIVLPLCLIRDTCGPFAAVTGYPVWCGIVFAVGGAHGWQCHRSPGKSSKLVALLIVSVISIVLSIVSFSLAAFDCSLRAVVMDPVLGYLETTESRVKRCFSVVLAVLSIVESSLAIANAVLSGRALGGCGAVVSTNNLQPAT